jgi:hypothetical protein
MPIELEKFRQQLIYEETAPISVIKTDLDDLAALDQLAELKQKKYGSKAISYFLVLLTLIIITIILLTFVAEIKIIGIVVFFLVLGCLGFGATWIYHVVMMNKFRRLNISNYRYELTKSLLEMLSRDIDTTSSVYVRINFNQTESNESRIDTIPHPYKSGWKIDIYDHEWLKITGSFLDKTRFFLHTHELSKRRYGWKRNSRGKSKYKSKVKKYGLEVHLSLTYPQRRYGAVKILRHDVINAVKLPPFSTLRRIKITDKVIYLIVRITPEFAEKKDKVYQTITSMFLSVYQVLNLAKIITK